MKHSRFVSAGAWGTVLLLALLLTGCGTLRYREVQADFDRAVQADLSAAGSPFIDWYGGVATTLTDAYIARLDPKLQPNAWTLRAVSEWRSRQFTNAMASAGRGLEEIGRQKSASPTVAVSRDAVLLTMLPGLVQDSQLLERFQERGRADVRSGYRSAYLPQFKAALRQFAEARQLFGDATPAAVGDYWTYQSWRVLNNWLFILGQLPVDEPATAAAYEEADGTIAGQFSSTLGGATLQAAIDAAKSALPEGHPYRRLIALEESR